MTHLFILDKVEVPPVTGERKIVLELAHALAQSNHDVFLFAEQGDALVEGVKIARIRDLLSVAMRSSPAIFEYHVTASTFTKTFWTKFLGKTRFVYAFMGGDLHAIFSQKHRVSLKVFEKVVNKALVVAEYQRSIIHQYVDVDVVVIPPFVQKKAPKSRISLEKDDPPRVLFMGIPSVAKGIDVLLKAYPQVLRAYPNCRLIIADSGENTFASRHAETLIRRLDLHESVDYVGVVNALELLAQVDLFVYPAQTIRDTMAIPLSILEALSVGTPAVSIDIGGVAEALPPEYIAPPQDHVAFADAMVNALDSDPPPLPSRFLLDEVLPQYIQFYETLTQ